PDGAQVIVDEREGRRQLVRDLQQELAFGPLTVPDRAQSRVQRGNEVAYLIPRSLVGHGSRVNRIHLAGPSRYLRQGRQHAAGGQESRRSSHEEDDRGRSDEATKQPTP